MLHKSALVLRSLTCLVSVRRGMLRSNAALVGDSLAHTRSTASATVSGAYFWQRAVVCVFHWSAECAADGVTLLLYVSVNTVRPNAVGAKKN